MPIPMPPAHEPEPRRPGAEDITERDGELALRLPEWDLLPPAEFLSRHQEGR